MFSIPKDARAHVERRKCARENVSDDCSRRGNFVEMEDKAVADPRHRVVIVKRQQLNGSWIHKAGNSKCGRRSATPVAIEEDAIDVSAAAVSVGSPYRQKSRPIRGDCRTC